MLQIKKIISIVFIVLFSFGCGLMKERELEKEKFNIFKEKVADSSVSLADWRHASNKEKYYFAEKYSLKYFGKIDYKKYKPIIKFLDTSVNKLTTALKAKNLEDKEIDKALGSSAFITMNAGARLMGWKNNK